MRKRNKRIIISFIFWVLLILSAADVSAGETVEDAVSVPLQETVLQAESAVIPVEDIDISDVADPMTVGTSQLLYVTVLPQNATDRRVTYTSLTPNIATVNSIGRVTAKSAGTAKISVSAGSVERFLIITVEAEEAEEIPVIDIDLSLSQKKITVGASTVISVTVYPYNATDQEVYFSSSDEAVLKVNSFGRVSGIAPGKATVTVHVGTVYSYVDIEVEETAVVRTIEVVGYDDKMETETEQLLSVTAYPLDAEDREIAYQSSEPYVASVSEGGVIEALHAGETQIIITAGEITKTLPLRVYVKTDVIMPEENYLVLQPGDTRSLNAAVSPAGADQVLTYHSTNENVLTVDEDGTVQAVGVGNASVIVSNTDSTAAVIVIVNKGEGSPEEENQTVQTEGTMAESGESALLMMIRSSEEQTVTVSGKEFSLVPQDALIELHNQKKDLCVVYDGYSVTISGQKIKNAEKEFSPAVEGTENEEGYAFRINKGNGIPGEVTVHFTSEPFDYAYLYLRNESSQNYERLNAIENRTVRVDTPGTYLLTKEKKKSRIPVTKLIVSGCIGLAVFIAVYIVIRKKYWFW